MRRSISFIAQIIAGIFWTSTVWAAKVSDSALGQLKAGGSASGLLTSSTAGAADPRVAVAGLLQELLGLIGIIFVCLIVMGGYWLITAKGDESKIEKAKSTIWGAVIGVIIILLAYSIVWLVSSSLQSNFITGTKPI